MNGTGWSRGLEVTGGGTGIVSHAGLVLLRQLADRTGLTAGLSRALPSPLWGHDRGRVVSDLACAIADGARVISDFRVMGDQRELFGPVASVPTAWRSLKEIAGAGDRAQRKLAAAVNRARRQGVGDTAARDVARVADKTLDGVRVSGWTRPWCPRTRIRSWRSPISRDSAITRWSPNATTCGSRWRGCCAPARPGRIPPLITCRSWARRSPRRLLAFRRKLMITCDGAGASHALIRELDKLAARPGYQVIYSVGWELGKREKAALAQVPEDAWEAAVDAHGKSASAARTMPAVISGARTGPAGSRKPTSSS